MKKYNYIPIVLLITIVLNSCNSDEVICTDETDPNAFCNSQILSLKIVQDSSNDMILSLNSSQRPIASPLQMNELSADVQNNLNLFSRPWQNDAYDTSNNIYYYNFPYQQLILKYDINTQSRTVWNYIGALAAPIVVNGMLYAIEEFVSGYPGNFTVKNIDTATGTVSSLASYNIGNTGSFNFEFASSTSDGNGHIYFLVQSKILIYDIVNDTVAMQDLSLASPSASYIYFSGIEQRTNQKLIALRKMSDPDGDYLQIIEIDPQNFSANPIVLFDFYAHNLEYNVDYYSTAYDTCDDTYYVSSRIGNSIMVYEINLSDGTFSTQSISDPFFGLTIKNQ